MLNVVWFEAEVEVRWLVLLPAGAQLVAFLMLTAQKGIEP